MQWIGFLKGISNFTESKGTRHRILGLRSDDNYQIVFSDSPGIIEKPLYGMQEAMNKFAFSSFEDADVILFVTDIFEKYTGEEAVIHALNQTEVPKILIINKIDLDKEDKADAIANIWQEQKLNTEQLVERVVGYLPESEAYYPKDQLSDKPERFFAAEIIREKILLLYKQEVPYSCEVIVHRFKEEEKNGQPLLKIYADIYVDRKSQKPIIIGKGGEAIKKLGITARASLEAFFEQHVYLDLNVKIKENWRNDERTLKHFGYENG